MRVLKKKSFGIVAGALMLAACQQPQVSVRPVVTGLQADAVPAKGSFYSLGKSYLKSSAFGLAIDAFRRDISVKGYSVRALNGLGVAYDMLGRYDLSQRYYEQALELDPTSSMTFGNLAYSQYTQGDYAAAAALAGKAKELLASGLRKKMAAAKIVLTNLQIAGEKKVKEEQTGAKDASLDYRVQHVGERNWEIMQEKQQRVARNTSRYKSTIAVQQILDRASDNIALREVLGGISGWKESKAATVEQPAIFSCRIINGTGRPRMATHMASFLSGKGLQGYGLSNADSYDHHVSMIEFSPGYGEEAGKLARALPIPVKTIETADLQSKIEFTLGADLISFDTSLFPDNGAS